MLLEHVSEQQLERLRWRPEQALRESSDRRVIVEGMLQHGAVREIVCNEAEHSTRLAATFRKHAGVQVGDVTSC